MTRFFVHLLLLLFWWLVCPIFGLYSQTPADSTKTSNQAHPRILVNETLKGTFRDSVKEVAWKSKLIDRKKIKLQQYLSLCKDQPDWLLSRLQMNWETRHSEVYLVGGKFSHSDGNAPVPTVRYSGSRDWATDYQSLQLEDVQPYLDDKRGLYLQRKDTKEWGWVEPSKTGHIIENINEDVMRLVADAAFLYWLTGEIKYAEFAAPVFFQYMEGMHHRNPPTQIDDSGQAGLSGLATFEVIHESIVISLAITYDFLYDYFLQIGKDLSNSQAVFQKWGDQIIRNGVPENNWNLFQARFLTYIALVLEVDKAYKNGKGRQYYLRKTFDQSSPRQIALKESLLVYDQENGMWPESPSYSMHVNTTLLEILTLLDHLTGANELDNYPIVEKAAQAAFQYLFPSGFTVGFGDSNHRTVPPKNLELLIANYRKYRQEEKESVITGLLNQLIQNGTYERTGDGLFELFFYVDELLTEKHQDVENSLITPTFYAPNVSMFIQRLGKGKDAMMISTVGSFGNHAHANGIAIELFANNYVLGPDMGRGISYWNPDHREYYSQFPAHNTVVVDGISTYRAMRSYNPYTLENCFPKSQSNPLFEKVTYSKVSFVEPKTSSDQQRLTAQVMTESGQSYAFDIFRSKKIKDTTQMHDYIYHNLGQSVQILNKTGHPIALSPTEELASSQGEQKAYDYFTDKKKVILSEDFQTLFALQNQEQPDNLMRLWVKGQTGQQVYTVNGPKSRAISKGTAPEDILDAPIPALVLRRNNETWVKPFVVVFNPYQDIAKNSLEGVKFDQDQLGGQQITIDMVDGNRDQIRAGISETSVLEDDHFFQKGLLSVVRLSKTDVVEFIFVSGVNVFKYKGWDIISEGEPATVTVQKDGNRYFIQNDQPILLRIAKTSEFNPTKISTIRNNEQVEVKRGIVSRFNKDQVDFRLAKPYEILVLE